MYISIYGFPAMIVSTTTMAITGCVPGTLQLLAHVVQHVYYSMYDFQFANTMTDGEKNSLLKVMIGQKGPRLDCVIFLLGVSNPESPIAEPGDFVSHKHISCKLPLNES